MSIHPLAGKLAPAELLIDVPQLERAYYERQPDLSDPDQLVSFGTSGHRGSAFRGSFNEAHILATTQAICDYRRGQGIDGPLFMGKDPHALSGPAQRSALEVLAANGVTTQIQRQDGFTPTPVISHVILVDNRDVKRMPWESARQASTTSETDFARPYVKDLANVIDMAAIRAAGLRIGIDPLGGAAVGYWAIVAEEFGLDLTVVNSTTDPTFRFMTVDHDGKIRMDCSSPYAMAGLVTLKDRFDIAFGNDPDADRHGIVTRSQGLLNPNHY